MARQARSRELFGVYHITQQGGSGRPLFSDRKDREKWLELVGRVRGEFGFKLYAYCASDSNEYHLVLNLQGADISKIMKSINIAYAMYAKSPDQLFRDRYKSRLLKTSDELLVLLASIHRRSQRETGNPDPYNSFCSYRGVLKDPPIPVDTDDIRRLAEVFPDSSGRPSCDGCLQTMDSARSHLQRIASESGLTVAMVLSDKKLRNRLICRFRQESTLSLKELGQLLGNLSESTVSKIIRNQFRQAE